MCELSLKEEEQSTNSVPKTCTVYLRWKWHFRGKCSKIERKKKYHDLSPNPMIISSLFISALIISSSQLGIIYKIRTSEQKHTKVKVLILIGKVNIIYKMDIIIKILFCGLSELTIINIQKRSIKIFHNVSNLISFQNN